MTNEQLLTYIRVKTHDLDKIAFNCEDEPSLELQFLKKKIKQVIHEAVKRGLWQDETLQWSVRTYINFYYPNSLKEQDDAEIEYSLDTIINMRRSIRHYDLTKTVSRKTILELVNAGRWAPSACNRQPVRFLILESEESKQIAFSIRRDKTILRADKVIAVLVDNKSYNNIEIAYTPYLDSAAAIQNILLKVHELKLGACWINFGVYECGNKGLEYFSSYFELPDYLSCVSLIALGYPAKQPRPVHRKKCNDIIMWQ